MLWDINTSLGCLWAMVLESPHGLWHGPDSLTLSCAVSFSLWCPSVLAVETLLLCTETQVQKNTPVPMCAHTPQVRFTWCHGFSDLSILSAIQKCLHSEVQTSERVATLGCSTMRLSPIGIRNTDFGFTTAQLWNVGTFHNSVSHLFCIWKMAVIMVPVLKACENYWVHGTMQKSDSFPGSKPRVTAHSYPILISHLFVFAV